MKKSFHQFYEGVMQARDTPWEEVSTEELLNELVFYLAKDTYSIISSMVSSEIDLDDPEVDGEKISKIAYIISDHLYQNIRHTMRQRLGDIAEEVEEELGLYDD